MVETDAPFMAPDVRKLNVSIYMSTQGLWWGTPHHCSFEVALCFIEFMLTCVIPMDHTVTKDDARAKQFMKKNEPCTLPIVVETLASLYVPDV